MCLALVFQWQAISIGHEIYNEFHYWTFQRGRWFDASAAAGQCLHRSYLSDLSNVWPQVWELGIPKCTLSVGYLTQFGSVTNTSGTGRTSSLNASTSLLATRSLPEQMMFEFISFFDAGAMRESPLRNKPRNPNLHLTLWHRHPFTFNNNPCIGNLFSSAKFPPTPQPRSVLSKWQFALVSQCGTWLSATFQPHLSKKAPRRRTSGHRGSVLMPFGGLHVEVKWTRESPVICGCIYDRFILTFSRYPGQVNSSYPPFLKALLVLLHSWFQNLCFNLITSRTIYGPFFILYCQQYNIESTPNTSTLFTSTNTST